MPKLPWIFGALILLLPIPCVAAVFNPSLLISDAYFTDVSSMDAAAIQRFLIDHGSVLATAPSTRLGSGANGRLAARIIFDAAQNQGGLPINPQVLLVTLQKEQSLITRSSANSITLDRAMGYGCPDAEACATRYQGFTNQVVSAAFQFAYNFSYAPRSHFSPGKVVSIRNEIGAPDYPMLNQSIWISNAATSALYQYTPHVYYGNQHFWSLTQNWFTATDVPYLAEAPGMATYYVSLGVRHRLAGPWLYPLLTLTSHSVHQLSTAQLRRLTNGPGIGVPSRDSVTNEVFIVTGGRKWRFPNEAMVTNWGFTPESIELVTFAALSPVPDGGEISMLQRTAFSSTVNAVISGKRFSASTQSLKAWGLQSTLPVTGGNELEYLLPKSGSLLTCMQNTRKMSYFLHSGKRYNVPAMLCKPSMSVTLPSKFLPPPA